MRVFIHDGSTSQISHLPINCIAVLVVNELIDYSEPTPPEKDRAMHCKVYLRYKPVRFTPLLRAFRTPAHSHGGTEWSLDAFAH